MLGGATSLAIASKEKNLHKKYQYKKAHTLKREEDRVNIYKRRRKHILKVISHITYSKISHIIYSKSHYLQQVMSFKKLFIKSVDIFQKFYQEELGREKLKILILFFSRLTLKMTPFNPDF